MSYELPFILYDNLMIDNTVTVVNSDADYPKENMWDYLDWTLWKSDSGGLITITIDTTATPVLADTLAILNHNLGSGANSGGCRIQMQESTVSNFATKNLLGNYYPDSDDPFYFKFTESVLRYIRIEISDMNDPISAAEVCVGMRMEIPVGPEFSFDPNRQRIESEKYAGSEGRLSSTGGKYSLRRMYVPFKRISQTFVDSDLLPFLEDHYGQMLPFFFVPDPGDVFGTGLIYYLTAPDNPRIRLLMYNDQITYRNWTLVADGVRQSMFLGL